MKKLKFRDVIGLVLGVSIVLIGSLIESLERESGKAPDILIIAGIIIVVCTIILINYGRKDI